MSERVVCLVCLPGEDDFTERMTFHRVPVMGDIVELGDDWPDDLAGRCFTVKLVSFTVLSPDHKSPPPPYIVLKR